MTEIAVYLRHAKRSHATKLDLSSKQLTSIPKQLLSMRNVESLDLSHNNIEHIDGSINELYKLKELDLSYNQFVQIPAQIGTLPLLSVLKIEGNPLLPKYWNLALPSNQKNPGLAGAMKQCFEGGAKEEKNQIEPVHQPPEWLIDTQSQNKQTNALWSGEQAFKLQKKPNRRVQRRKMPSQKQQKSNEYVFKDGVLEIRFEDLVIGEQISMGGFSTIHRGHYMGSEVALKKVFNPHISEELMAEFSNEITMLSRYRHPNIVLLLGAVTSPPNLCIVMQFFKEGTLYDLLYKKKTPIKQNQMTSITRQILQALRYLHSLGVVHRDIKSHNILLNSFLQVKLCDFGLARHQSELNIGPMQYCGTPTYMSPELFLKKAYDMSVDIFALGTLLYEIYAGEVPYHGIDPADIRERVLKDPCLPTKIGIKKPIIQMINKCRSSNPALRPTIKQLVEFGEW